MIIDNELLNQVTAQAQQSERLRMNFNFHDSPDAAVQQLLNALEPGTVVPIHRHRHTAESYLLLRGKLRVTFYTEAKEVKEQFLLDPLAGNYGIHIPQGTWHGLEVLEKGTVIYEVKEGPYAAITEEDLLK
ncbi:MAG: WbuC family cupin fold metalloprotein [Phocaeicola sp.]